MNIRPVIIQKNNTFSLDYSMYIGYSVDRDVAICVRGVLQLRAVMTVANGNIFIIFWSLLILSNNSFMKRAGLTLAFAVPLH